MIRARMVAILVNVLTVTPANYIHPSAAAAAAAAVVAARKRKLSIVQPETDRGRKKTHRTLPKRGRYRF